MWKFNKTIKNGLTNDANYQQILEKIANFGWQKKREIVIPEHPSFTQDVKIIFQIRPQNQLIYTKTPPFWNFFFMDLNHLMFRNWTYLQTSFRLKSSRNLFEIRLDAEIIWYFNPINIFVAYWFFLQNCFKGRIKAARFTANRSDPRSGCQCRLILPSLTI